MKKCNVCKQVKALEAFYFHHNKSFGRQDECKECKRHINKRLNAIHNPLQMRVEGKYIKKSHPLHIPGFIAQSWIEVYKAHNLPIPFDQSETNSPTAEGYVYVIYNPAWTDWYKVGKADDVEKRLRSYQTGDPHRAYKVCYEMFFDDCKAAEEAVLKALQEDDKVIKSHEWVVTSFDRIRNIINEVKREEASSGHRDELNSQFDLVLCN